MLRNGIPNYCLFRGMVRNRIPSVCSYFCSTERNSELFSLPQNGSEQNSEHFSPLRNGSERNSVNFLFRGTDGIPPEQTNCSVYSVFREIIFCRKLPTPTLRLTSPNPTTLTSVPRSIVDGLADYLQPHSDSFDNLTETFLYI
jgi:hypothetical protein